MLKIYVLVYEGGASLLKGMFYQCNCTAVHGKGEITRIYSICNDLLYDVLSLFVELRFKNNLGVTTF